MIEVKPQIFIIASTAIDDPGLHEFLKFIDVQDWTTDAFSDAEKLIEVAGKNCYMSFDKKLNTNLTRTGGRNNFDYIQDGLIGTKHGSVLEHATVTFAAVDVSRVLTHELVRHRVGAAYSQQSGRYVRVDEMKLYIPPEIKEKPELLTEFILTADIIHQRYKLLEQISGINEMNQPKDFEKKKRLTSALRRIRPNGEANSVVVTYNHRTLRQTIEARTSFHAEEEIRVAFWHLYMQLSEKFPSLYADAVVLEHILPGRAPQVNFTHSKI